jgi:hypothetical protein
MGSWCGRVDVGCWEARVSGAEKSRQVKQSRLAAGGAGGCRTVAEEPRAATASIWARVGRELTGTGGGAGGGDGLRAPFWKPLSKSALGRELAGGGGRRRAGRGGAGSSTGASAGGLAGLDGSLGGNEGLGGSAMRRGGRGGVALADSFSASSFAFASSSRLVGGSGGSLACSRGGGNLRGVGPWGTPLDVADLVWLRERLDTVDSRETSEAFEFRRTERVCAEGRREGSFGGVGCGEFRAGRGGGASRPGEGAGGCTPVSPPFSGSPVRRGSGGGNLSVAARTGRGGRAGLISAVAASDVVLLASSVRARTGGGRGGGRLPAAAGGD